MKLQDQLTSLAPSKKLKKLGVKQDSLWYWKFTKYPKGGGEWNLGRIGKTTPLPEHMISAFTAAELGEMLPDYEVDCYKEKGEWRCGTYMGKKLSEPENYWDKTEANARAKMLIYLIENKLLGKE